MVNPIIDLSDGDLRSELIEKGENPGPITTSTRSVYEKKLDRLRKSVSTKKSDIQRDTSPLVAKRISSTRNVSLTKKMSVTTPVTKKATKSRFSKRNVVISDPEISDSDELAPKSIKAITKKSDIVPGQANLSSSSTNTPTPPPPPSRRNFVGRPSSILSSLNPPSSSPPPKSIYGRPSMNNRRDPFAFSSTEDSDPDHNSHSLDFITRGSTGRALLSNKRDRIVTPCNRSCRDRSPFQSMILTLNKFRTDALRLLWRESGESKSDSYSYGIYANDSPYFRDGNLHQSRYGISRILFTMSTFFILVLVCAYIGSAHGHRIKPGFRVITGAAKDTADFLFTYAILPTFIVSIVGSLFLGGYMLQRFRRSRAEIEKRRKFALVKRIIAVLRRASSLDEASVPIPHVRDQLIGPGERKSVANLWTLAKAYIDENESRVSTETKIIRGQECLVWRWLGHNDDEEGDRDEGWQGSAFSDAQSDINSPRLPFSECLKLRGMFDPIEQDKDEWPDSIQDALLEKLGDQVRVLHLAVDKASKDGVVFIKLKSKLDAEIAFKCLHGTWFNGRIVSVKYLRTERYHQRFPEASDAVYPLQTKKPRYFVRRH